MDKTYTPKELAKLCHCDIVTVRKRIRAGELPAFKMGRGWVVSQSDLDEFINKRKNASLQKTQAERSKQCRSTCGKEVNVGRLISSTATRELDALLEL